MRHARRRAHVEGAALRDLVHELDGAVLPPNELLSPRIVDACTDLVRTDYGIELLRVIVTADALTDGYHGAPRRRLLATRFGSV